MQEMSKPPSARIGRRENGVRELSCFRPPERLPAERGIQVPPVKTAINVLSKQQSVSEQEGPSRAAVMTISADVRGDTGDGLVWGCATEDATEVGLRNANSGGRFIDAARKLPRFSRNLLKTARWNRQCSPTVVAEHGGRRTREVAKARFPVDDDLRPLGVHLAESPRSRTVQVASKDVPSSELRSPRVKSNRGQQSRAVGLTIRTLGDETTVRGPLPIPSKCPPVWPCPMRKSTKMAWPERCAEFGASASRPFVREFQTQPEP